MRNSLSEAVHHIFAKYKSPVSPVLLSNTTRGTIYSPVNVGQIGAWFVERGYDANDGTKIRRFLWSYWRNVPIMGVKKSEFSNIILILHPFSRAIMVQMNDDLP